MIVARPALLFPHFYISFQQCRQKLRQADIAFDLRGAFSNSAQILPGLTWLHLTLGPMGPEVKSDLCPCRFVGYRCSSSA